MIKTGFIKSMLCSLIFCVYLALFVAMAVKAGICVVNPNTFKKYIPVEEPKT